MFLLCEATVLESVVCAKPGSRIAVKRTFTDGRRFYCLVRSELDGQSEMFLMQIVEMKNFGKQGNRSDRLGAPESGPPSRPRRPARSFSTGTGA